MTPHAHEHDAHHRRPRQDATPGPDAGQAELLDLDAVVGASVLASALDGASRALGSSPASIVDLGAGTGTGTLALANRFPAARIRSLDASRGMLDRLEAAVATAGVAGRVEAIEVDLDADWPNVVPEAVDLAWAALSLHHVADPVQTLGQVLDLLRPGGVLVVIEMTGVTTYAPGDLGTGLDGLGERLVRALEARGYPATGEWTDALTAAGFDPVQRQESTFTASGQTSEGARYLALQLGLIRDHLSGSLAPDDLDALSSAVAALDGGRSETSLTSGRAIWVAVRPLAGSTDSEGEPRDGR
jgi:ubiquinone/menaquinone biosynthesis C-methylase UbiE